MPKVIYDQVKFTGGELSPLVDARVDLPIYEDAGRQVHNLIVQKSGGATRRPGTQLVASTKMTGQYPGSSQINCACARTFQFSPLTGLVFEFGNGYVRFYQGGTNPTQVNVTSATRWVPGQFYPAGSYMGWRLRLPFDTIFYSTGNVAPSALNPFLDPTNWIQQSILEQPTPYQATYYPQNTPVYNIVAGGTYSIAYVGNTDFTTLGAASNLVGTVFVSTVGLPGTPVTSGTGIVNGVPVTWAPGTFYFSGNFVNVAGVQYRAVANNTSAAVFTTDLAVGYWEALTAPTTPHTTDVFQVVVCQINDVVYLAHPFYPPWKLTSFSTTDWTSANVHFLTPPLLDQNATDTAISASALTGFVNLTVTAPAWVPSNYYNIGNSVEVTTTAGAFVAGSIYVIASIGSTDYTLIGATSNTLGLQFTATGAGAGTGTAYAIYNCVLANVSGGTFVADYLLGYWVDSIVFNQLHAGSTWQLAYLNNSAYMELDGTTATGFTTGTSTGFKAGTGDGASWASISPTPYHSGWMQSLGDWELHTYGVWIADIAIQQSLDGGITWNTVRTVSGRADRNVDITGTAVQLSFYRIVLSSPSGLSLTPTTPGATVPRAVFQNVNSFLYGLVLISGVQNAYQATATVKTQLYATTPTQYWNEGAWSNYRGFPQAVTTFQQRMVYGGTGFQPQRVWGTVTNDLENFALGAQDLATDSYVFDIAATARGPIQWLKAQTDLFVGFSGAEWVVNSGQGTGGSQSITPTQINATEHSTWGSATGIPATVVGDACFYVQRQGRTFRQMLFSVYTNKYMSQDLAAWSDHLFSLGIIQMAYQPQFENNGLLWAVTGAGTLCALTYEMEQGVFAWSRHTTGDVTTVSTTTVTAGSFVAGTTYVIATPGTTNFIALGAVTNTAGAMFTANGPGTGTGTAHVTTVPDAGFESVTVLDGQGINDDEVWAISNRILSNGTIQRFMERLYPINWQFSTGATNASSGRYAYYVDCGVQTVNPITNVISINGLLEGRAVSVTVNGQSVAGLSILGGLVTIPGYVPAYGDVVNVGLPVGYHLQPMRLDKDVRVGNTQGLTKILSDVYIRLNNSLGGYISNGTLLVPINYTTMTQTAFTPNALFTGQVRVQPFSSYSDDPPYILTNVTPSGADALPMSCLAFICKYDLSGTP